MGLTLQYVLLFSISLIRVIYDFVDQPPTVLRAMSRWFVFAQGVLDALIYGLVEWQYVHVPSFHLSSLHFPFPVPSICIVSAWYDGADELVRNEWYDVEYEREPYHPAAQGARVQVQEIQAWLPLFDRSISEDQPEVSVPVRGRVRDLV